MLAHGRRLVGIMLPLGALIGFSVGLALKGLDEFGPWIGVDARRIHLTPGLPVLGLFLATLLLQRTRVGEASLPRDLEIARRNPYLAFPPGTSLVKLVACFLTIGFGGSAGVEGPGKWFGSALGVQVHRILKLTARYHPFGRRLLAPARVIVMAGAAAALSAVFRAPLTGTFLAVEHDGMLQPKAMVPALVASASGYLAFSSVMGLEPLLPLPHAYHLHTLALLWALLLGMACGLAASAYQGVESLFRWLLRNRPLPVRGLLAGAGLVLLAAPAHFFWKGEPVTQGGAWTWWSSSWEAARALPGPCSSSP
jgi:CIC family chloride channel protein